MFFTFVLPILRLAHASELRQIQWLLLLLWRAGLDLWLAAFVHLRFQAFLTLLSFLVMWRLDAVSAKRLEVARYCRIVHGHAIESEP